MPMLYEAGVGGYCDSNNYLPKTWDVAFKVLENEIELHQDFWDQSRTLKGGESATETGDFKWTASYPIPPEAIDTEFLDELNGLDAQSLIKGKQRVEAMINNLSKCRINVEGRLIFILFMKYEIWKQVNWRIIK